MIVPHLMTTAPTIFSSSLDEETLKRRENQVVDDVNEILIDILDEENAYEQPTEDDIEDIGFVVEGANDAAEMNEPVPQVSQPDIHHPKRPSTTSSTSAARKSKRASSTHNLDEEEKELKTRRLQSIMKHETEIFFLKKSQEEELHELAKAKGAYELRAAKAVAELAECLLANEKSK